MRKTFKLFIFTAFACTFLLGADMSAQAASKVAINDTNFSSEVKRKAEEADTNGDGYLSKTEASKVKTLRLVPNYNLDSFKGIEYFKDITYFYYRGRSAGEYEDFDIIEESTASEINLSGFKKLERVKIDCRTPYLKTVNLEDCTRLKELTIEGGVMNTDGITNINLKGCVNLQTVDFSEIFVNKLNLSGMKKLTSVSAFGYMETVNLKKCTSLKTAYLGGSQLKNVKLKNAKKLEDLSVRSDVLTTLDVSTNTQLKELYLGQGTALTSLDLSHNTKLTTMECYQTKLTALDFSHNKNLVKVDCHNNKNIASINVKGCKKLRNLRFDNTKVTKINVKTNTNLRNLRCENTPLTKLNLKKNTQLQNLRCENTDIRELDLTNTKIRKQTALKCDPDVAVTYAAK